MKSTVANLGFCFFTCYSKSTLFTFCYYYLYEQSYYREEKLQVRIWQEI